MSYSQLVSLAAPEIFVAITALAVLALDLLVMRDESLRNRFWIGTAFAAMGCVAAAVWMVAIAQQESAQGMFVTDNLTCIVKIGILALTICTLVISMESNFTTHVGEYLALVLFATVGMMMLVSATDLLLVFIALELTSLSLYILAAFNKRNVKSAEAALKYFLFGGMSAAFTLFGISLVYGLAGTTNLHDVGAKIGRIDAIDGLLIAALVMTAIGFGFKVAAAPFHLWAPDAYEGAPTSSAALIASGSKVASFFVFARVMFQAFGGVGGGGDWGHFNAGWVPALAILAAASMFVGNLVAIVQGNVKRLLAYSAIAHAGYALLGMIANNEAGLGSLIYYATTYGLTVVGAFGVVGVVEETSGGARLENFAGLGKREPAISFCMMIFMLSLAGIPPLAGFFGKFYLFAAVVSGGKGMGMMWLVFFAVAMSAVSLYYYLQVLKQIYVTPASNGTNGGQAPVSSRILLAAVAAGVVLLGCAPNLLVERLLAAIHGF